MAEYFLTAPIRFFAGAEAPAGYTEVLSEVGREADWQRYLLKGGPSDDKRTLLAVATQLAAPWEPEMEWLMRSPKEPEAVICPQCRLCVLDAVAPHAIEPAYWTGNERLVLSDAGLVPERLATEPIVELTDDNALLRERYRQFIAAAASLLADNARIAAEYTDTEKIRRLAGRLSAAEILPSAVNPTEQRRFLSSVTAEGITVFYTTLQALCPKIYVIEDENGVCADRLLRELRQNAIEKGQPLISCFCPLAPQERMEHLLLPEAGIAFTASNSFHTVDFPVYRRIHAARFTDTEALRRRRQRMTFNRRAAEELLSEAAAVAAEADDLRARLCAYRQTAADPERSAALRQTFFADFAASLDARREPS